MTRMPCGLREAAEVGDRDARHAVDRVDAVELQRIDDEMEAVGQVLALRSGHVVASPRALSGIVRCRCPARRMLAAQSIST